MNVFLQINTNVTILTTQIYGQTEGQMYEGH